MQACIPRKRAVITGTCLRKWMLMKVFFNGSTNPALKFGITSASKVRVNANPQSGISETNQIASAEKVQG
jgi:hypothetical protein